MNDTIIALATPSGRGALAVIRISGEDAIKIIGKCITESRKYNSAKSNVVKIYSFVDKKKEIIDEITAVKYFTPHSFTGENMVEIICHGSMIVVDKILEVAINEGARYADKGEFTRRAFLNGKTNLEKAESINQIINSSSLLEHKNAIYSYFEGSSTLIKKWKKWTENILINSETEIEFNESVDVSENVFENKINNILNEFEKELQVELDKRKFIKENSYGIRLPIIGPPNAGKSSILNLVLGYERSIIHSQEGTTRDYVSEVIELNKKQIQMIDTAGIKESENIIEKKGIEKSFELIENNKTVLWVTAANENITKEEKKINNDTIIGIINKIDLSNGKEKEKYFQEKAIPYIKMKAIDYKQRDKLVLFIEREIEKKYQQYKDNSIIATKRQEKIIEEILEKIRKIKKYTKSEEIVSLYCNDILKKIEEFTGKITTEDIINKIFDEFCVGK